MSEKSQELSIKTSENDQLYNNGRYHRPPEWLLQARAKAYLKQILRKVQIGSHQRVLEVGCDLGQLTNLLRKYSETVIGVDVNPTYINKLNQKYFMQMDAQNLDFPDESFDFVISTHTIEHIPDISKALYEFERVLKANGYLILIYPWEPIRGYTVLPEALLHYKSIKVCREIHLHNFTPKKINRLIDRSTLMQLSWQIFFVPHPNFISVYQRIDIDNSIFA